MKLWPVYVAGGAAAVLVFVLRGPPAPPQAASSAANRPRAEADTWYWTTPGIEPDTCIAAWLLTRVVSPGSPVRVLESSGSGTPFDVPETDLCRQPGHAVSDLIVERFAVQDGFAVSLAAVARELELNPWTMNEEPFFSQVRAGLADALNAPESDEECLQRAIAFLDGLRRPMPAPASGAPPRNAPRAP